MKNYLTLARVSSEEQKHGFSLDIQEDALREWAAKNSAGISKMYRVAETAHKSGERKTFHEMLDYVTEPFGVAGPAETIHLRKNDSCGGLNRRSVPGAGRTERRRRESSAGETEQNLFLPAPREK